MFLIEDGRKHFYQWDTNQRLIVEDNFINEVHFCNKTDEVALICEVYEESGMRLVNVPNILLQENLELRVYAYNECTEYEERYKVVGRAKPSDYVYEETELKNYDDLEERLEVVELGLADLEENLGGYATEEFVTDALANLPTGGSGSNTGELIEEINLSEAVTAIEREVEPNGTPYNFRNVIITIKTPTKWSSTVYAFVKKNVPVYQAAGYITTNNGQTQYQHGTVFYLNTDKGILEFSAKQGIIYGTTQTQIERFTVIDSEFNEMTSINYLKLDTRSISKAFLAGTIIKIYGVRA